MSSIFVHIYNIYVLLFMQHISFSFQAECKMDEDKTSIHNYHFNISLGENLLFIVQPAVQS